MFLIYIGGIIAFAFFSLLPPIVYVSSGHVDWLTCAIGATGTLLVGWRISTRFMMLRPIGVSDSGISAYFFGRKAKHFRWDTVGHMEMVWWYSSNQCKMRYNVSVQSKASKIYFEDLIDSPNLLILELNKYANDFNIPIYETNFAGMRGAKVSIAKFDVDGRSRDLTPKPS
jgi:hypothetical protein